MNFYKLLKGIITSVSRSSPTENTEWLIVSRIKGIVEIYGEKFGLIFRCKNLHEGVAIIRNDLSNELSKEDLQMSMTDVTSNIDTSYIPIASETQDVDVTIKETFLANIQGKILFLVLIEAYNFNSSCLAMMIFFFMKAILVMRMLKEKKI